jgi:hypothetical protein
MTTRRVPRTQDLTWSTVGRVGGALAAGALAATLVSTGLTAQTPARSFALESSEGLRLANVAAQPATLDGKRGLRVRLSEEAQKKRQSMTPQQQEAAVKAGQVDEQLAIVDGLEFGDGVIDVEVAGSPRTEMFQDARGFVGIAFRLQPDLRTYDAFYLRPTNGRADDQVRRNHSTQYISHPDWPWFRLRRETPEKYESYVDLVPGVWTKMRIEVRGTEGRLFVHGQPQPTLIVKDLKTGAAARGAVALWLDASTDVHFRNLVVTPAAGATGPR